LNSINLLRNRLRQINAKSRPVEMASLFALQGLMRSSAPLVGSKLVFFISDGFIVDNRKSAAPEIMRAVIQEAARVGAVVYSINARGSLSDPAIDASRNDYPDFSSRQAGRALSESKTPQEPLETIANETGGRAILNSNAFDDAIRAGLAETSDYYLLAWRPENAEQHGAKVRVEISVKDRPDLRVRLRRRVLNFNSGADDKGGAAATTTATPEQALQAALSSLYPRREIPTELSVGFVNTPGSGMVLNASMQLDGSLLGFGEGGGAQKAAVDVLGAALDDRGKFYTFKQRLAVDRETVTTKGERFIVWNQQLPLEPGLYQVRVAVRDGQTGRLGSAMQWIEVPQITPKDFSLSSVFVGERKAADEAGAQSVKVNVTRRFAQSSRLRFQTYIYNAGEGGADVTVQVTRDGGRVLTVQTGRQLAEKGSDAARIPYSGEFALNQLKPGWYVLQVSAADGATKAGVTRMVNFVVE
ncbi:MAG TPA: hypothetical protein VF507_08840, partial [Pyrinomonadaceae bacterium]